FPRLIVSSVDCIFLERPVNAHRCKPATISESIRKRQCMGSSHIYKAGRETERLGGVALVGSLSREEVESEDQILDRGGDILGERRQIRQREPRERQRERERERERKEKGRER